MTSLAVFVASRDVVNFVEHVRGNASVCGDAAGAWSATLVHKMFEPLVGLFSCPQFYPEEPSTGEC